MSAVLVPFFLAARLALDISWVYGPKFVFQVEVNSTAIPDEGSYGSVRLNVASRLVCQPVRPLMLSCHFCDSRAESFLSDSLNPAAPAVPVGPVTRQESYEMSHDQFEIKFNRKGLEDLLVSENIQPRELDMIRAIVGQLSIGSLDKGLRGGSYQLVENFTHGECVTKFTVDRRAAARFADTLTEREYVLETAFRLKGDQLVQIEKIRNLQMCTHTVPYYFGGGEGFRQDGDVFSTVSSSDSYIIVTTTEFVSGTSNVITTSKISEDLVTNLHETISLRLESIRPAEAEPPPVEFGELASVSIGRWLLNTEWGQ